MEILILIVEHASDDFHQLMQLYLVGKDLPEPFEIVYEYKFEFN